MLKVMKHGIRKMELDNTLRELDIVKILFTANTAAVFLKLYWL